MSSPEDRIKELAKKSAIDPAEAERLLAAVRTPPLRPARSIWNPFERVSGEVASVLGIPIALVALAMSHFDLRTDGVVSMHHVAKGVPLSVAALDQVLAFPFAAVVLWIAARIAAKQVRFVDILGTVGLARLPVALIMVPLAPLEQYVGPAAKLTHPLVLLSVLIALGGMGFHIFLLVVGFRTATGLHGARLTVTFVSALAVAEITAQIISSLVFH